MTQILNEVVGKRFKASRNPNFKADEIPQGLFDGYDATRIVGSPGLSAVKAPDGKTLAEKLNAEKPEAKFAKDELAKALKKTGDYEAAKDTYKADLANLPSLLKVNSNAYRLGTVADVLLNCKSEAVHAIKNQQAHEITQVSQLFDNPEFKQKLEASLDYSEAEIAGIKQSTIDTLKKSHQEELDKFDKANQDVANKILKAAEKDHNRLIFLASGYLANRTRQDIENLAGKKHGSKTLVNNEEDDSDILKDLQVTDLKQHYTLNGNAITIDGNVCTVTRTVFNKLTRSENKDREDFRSVAMLLKAKGHDHIVYNFKTNDPEEAEELARQAYEEAVNVGFDPKKITITINGEVKMKHNKNGDVETNELFKGYSANRLERAKRKAKTVAEKLETSIKADSTESKFLKESLREMREAQAKTQEELRKDSSTPSPTATPPAA